MSPETDPFARDEARPASIPPGLHAGLSIANKYELTRKLGTGAMGEVWAAKHVSLGEEVAIKLVKRDVAHGDGTSAEDRFLLEARVSAALARKTRHIVSVTDHGEDGALAYLVMELLDGESLDARLARKGQLSLAEVVPIISQIARGLAVAHAEGIVHRDLKPSNVFVTRDEDGRALVKILDFGIAKLRASLRRIPTSPPALAGGAKHATQHGFLLGTPSFMSPEQARGRTNLDHRADVWALGVIAYHLLTGQYPFDGESFEELLERLCRVRYTSILKHRPDLPEVVADFFARAFAMRIEQRFQTATAFAAAFGALEPLAKATGVSLPPPPPAAEEPVDPGSMVAAGVPAKGSLGLKLGGAALVASVLAGTIALLAIDFEREPAVRGAKLTSGANITSAGRDSIPAPEEETAPAPAVDARELPSAPRVNAGTAKPLSATPPPPASPPEPSAPGASDPSPTAAERKPVDKSEIF